MLSMLSASQLFVASEQEPPVLGDSLTSVPVRIGAADGRMSAYLFSSEGLLRAWCIKMGWPTFPVQLSGGELPVALPKGCWVEIDPGTPHHVILSPKQLERLAQPAGQGVVADDAGFTSWVPREQQAPVADSQQPAEMFPEPGLAEQDASPVDSAVAAKRRLFSRSNPTTVFAAPTLDKKTDLESRPRTYTSSNLKKVIKPSKPEDEER
jgi:hypothetical protein